MDGTHSEDLSSHIETLELINNEIRDSLARLSDADARVDTKAIVLVGYAGGVAAFLATRHAQVVFAGLAFTAFGLSAICGILSYAFRKPDDAPYPRSLLNRYMTRPRADTLVAIAATRARVYENNKKKLTEKVRIWRAGLAILAAGIILMIISILGQSSHHESLNDPRHGGYTRAASVSMTYEIR
jgi:hypothetical protein